MRHAGTRPGVVPNDGDNAGVPGKGSSASSRQRIAAAGLIASSSPMMRDGLAEVIEVAASPRNVLRVEGMRGWL